MKTLCLFFVLSGSALAAYPPEMNLVLKYWCASNNVTDAVWELNEGHLNAKSDSRLKAITEAQASAMLPAAQAWQEA